MGTSDQDSLRGRIVMVVDDEAAARIPIREYLSRLQCRVFEAADGIQALELAERVPDLELMVVDVVMPRLDGTELVERLLGTRPNLRMLLISGFLAGPSVERLLASPRVDFLEKPFSFRTLAARASRLLREPDLGAKEAARGSA